VYIGDRKNCGLTARRIELIWMAELVFPFVFLGFLETDDLSADHFPADFFGDLDSVTFPVIIDFLKNLDLLHGFFAATVGPDGGIDLLAHSSSVILFLNSRG
jgi:hypothetical protein